MPARTKIQGMDSESVPLVAGERSSVHREAQRRRARHKLNALVYVSLDQGNGGIIRDLSEYGLAVQAVTSLRIHEHIRLRFDLQNPKTRIDAVGLVTWTNPSGQAGIQFTQIGHRARQLLKDWLLVGLLARASYSSYAPAIFRDSKQTDGSELIFSTDARPPIQLGAAEASKPGERLTSQGKQKISPDVFLDFSWWPVPIAAITLSRTVDSFIVLISLSLFCVIFLAITHELLPWPLCLAVATGTAAGFAGLYRFLFVKYSSGTVGFKLAKFAADKVGSNDSKIQHVDTERRELTTDY
jgi:PilZ domain-containing protein